MFSCIEQGTCEVPAVIVGVAYTFPPLMFTTGNRCVNMGWAEEDAVRGIGVFMYINSVSAICSDNLHLWSIVLQVELFEPLMHSHYGAAGLFMHESITQHTSMEGIDVRAHVVLLHAALQWKTLRTQNMALLLQL